MTNSDFTGIGSSSASGSNSDSVSGLKFELSSSQYEKLNEVIDVVDSKAGIFDGDTNNMLSIRKDVNNGCPSILCSKDIVSYSDRSCLRNQ